MEGVESLRKIWMWMGWGDTEHEMVKLINALGSPLPRRVVPLNINVIVKEEAGGLLI